MLAWKLAVIFLVMKRIHDCRDIDPTDYSHIWSVFRKSLENLDRFLETFQPDKIITIGRSSFITRYLLTHAQPSREIIDLDDLIELKKGKLYCQPEKFKTALQNAWITEEDNVLIVDEYARLWLKAQYIYQNWKDLCRDICTFCVVGPEAFKGEDIQGLHFGVLDDRLLSAVEDLATLWSHICKEGDKKSEEIPCTKDDIIQRINLLLAQE